MGFHVIHYKDDSQDQEQALRILIYIWSIPKIAETPFQSSLVPWWWVNLKKGYVIYMKYKTKCEILQLLLWLVYVLKIEKKKGNRQFVSKNRQMWKWKHVHQRNWLVCNCTTVKNSNLHQNHYIAQFENNVE